MSTKKLKTVARLAVVSKDFSIYYIPGKSIVQGIEVNQIEEHTENFSVVDFEGNVLAEISKKLPFLVEYTDVIELPEENVESKLISFGNHLFEKYGVMVHSNDGENKPIYRRQVTHADICNWEESYKDLTVK